MSVGQQLIIKIHEDDTNTVVLDSVNLVNFTQDASFGASPVTNVIKQNFTGDDPTQSYAFVVSISYPTASPPNMAQTLTQVKTLAINAVNAVYGNGTAGPAT